MKLIYKVYNTGKHDSVKINTSQNYTIGYLINAKSGNLFKFTLCLQKR